MDQLLNELEALTRAWETAEPDGELAAVEQEAWALRYAVLVVVRGAVEPVSEAAHKLIRGALAMRTPGSPPMAMVAAGRFAASLSVDVPEPLRLWSPPPNADGELLALVCLVPPDYLGDSAHGSG